MFPRDFPGPVVKTMCYTSAGGSGLIPGWGTKIPHAAWSGQNNKILKKKINTALLQKRTRGSALGLEKSGHPSSLWYCFEIVTFSLWEKKIISHLTVRLGHVA